MKFRYKDQVVCTDAFYQVLENPAMPESPSNQRYAAVGEIRDYKIEYGFDAAYPNNSVLYTKYQVAFDTITVWINDDMLQLYSAKRLT